MENRFNFFGHLPGANTKTHLGVDRSGIRMDA